MVITIYSEYSFDKREVANKIIGEEPVSCFFPNPDTKKHDSVEHPDTEWCIFEEVNTQAEKDFILKNYKDFKILILTQKL